MFSLSVPSKTFLAGEYSALFGGPALLINTSPRFVLKASLSIGLQSQRVGLSQAGPAAVLLENPAFKDYDLQFIDPHNNRGGLGGSSAQFALLHAFLNWLKFEPTRWDKTLKCYRAIAKSSESYTPSGYDVVSQMIGKLAFVHMATNRVEQLDWPFKDIEAVLIRGPLKVATYKHLEDLRLNDTAELVKRSSSVYEAVKNAAVEDFVRSIRDFNEILNDEGLVAPESSEVQKLLSSRSEVLAVKGCGALGADIIMAVVVKAQLGEFSNFLREQKLDWIGSTQFLSPGLQVDEMAHGELQSTLESEYNYYKEQYPGLRNEMDS
jgi:mevalonate kinase